MRVVIAAIALCALSFVAGVAGDLSMASPNEPVHGQRVVVRVPPDAIRAHPLPPLATTLATSSAAAAEMPAPRRRAQAAASSMVKHRPTPAFVVEPKENPDRAPKADAPVRRPKGAG